MRSMRMFLAVVGTMLATGVPRLAAQDRGYVVIVHESNYLTSLSVGELNRLFMRQTVRWTTGQAVTPVDLKADSHARELFSEQVMRKTTTEVKAYWQTVIFSGRGIPPMEAPSEPTVVAFVRANPGAIAYVSASTPLGPGVRTVRIRD